jgi:hypothetical protein
VNGRTAVLIYNNHPDQFMKLGQDANTTFIGRDNADEFAIGLFDNASDTTLDKQFVIDSSGNVGIGTSSPSTFQSYANSLVVGTGVGGEGITVYSGTLDYGALVFADGTSGNSQLRAGQVVYDHGTNSMFFNTNASEAMRIDSSGNLLVGTTSVISAGVLNTSFLGGTKNGIDLQNTNSGNSGAFIGFFNSTGSLAGAITQTGATTTNYGTSSDQRLKENIQDADDAGSKIDAIQVRQYDWKADGSHQDYGMIAQELQTVAPEAVSGDADSEEMMGVDYSKLVPMLIKEIQSLRNRVAQLEE